MEINNLNKKQKKIFEYYKKYYYQNLGLKNWKYRVEKRLNEEANYSQKFINIFKNYFNYEFRNKNVLSLGCGTGGELSVLLSKGANIYGVDPDEKAIEITKEKLINFNINTDNIVLGSSEKIPFNSNFFDFIICNTVLEHVNNVELSISEIVRTLKIDGKCLIITPDYRQLWEPHYKLPLPIFLPKIFNLLLLLILRRPIHFYKSINFVNSKKLINILKKIILILSDYT